MTATARSDRPVSWLRAAVRRFSKLRRPQGRSDARWWVSRRVLNPVLQPFGFVVVADHFYQPLLTDRARRRLVRPARVPPGYEAGADDGAELLRTVLDAHLGEFEGPSGPRRFGYTSERSQLGVGDQEVLYGLMRHLRPRRVVEIGAGGSTQIIGAALSANADGARFTSVEPHPAPWLRRAAERVGEVVDFELIVERLEEVGADLVSELAAGDVLFVDSSHVYRPGSDVEHEFLHLYPRLADGVIVHVHDIFLPSDYPQRWNTHHRRYWNEQYVLEAVLANSDRFEPILPLAYLVDRFRPLVEGYFPETLEPGSRPGSLWLRVRR